MKKKFPPSSEPFDFELAKQKVFTSDMDLLKLIYLATERIARKWTMPLHGWAVSAS